MKKVRQIYVQTICNTVKTKYLKNENCLAKWVNIMYNDVINIQGGIFMKLVILDSYTENPGDLSWDWLKDEVDCYEVYERTPVELIEERCQGADIVVTNKALITKQLIDSLPQLKFIAVLATGYNVVDVKAAAEKGIVVSNIPAYSTDGVAQQVFALLLEMTNAVGLHSKSVMDGEWSNCPYFCYWKTPLTELAGKTMGIIGFGKIGFAVAQIANAMKMKVIAYSPNTRSYQGFGTVDFLSLNEVVRLSDVISLHCPLTDETNGLVNAEFIAKMKRGAYLINTSRGPVLNEEDVKNALESGKLGGVGVDVLSCEPPVNGSPLINAKNCFITPHISWASHEARERLMNIFRQNVHGFVTGKPINVVS